MTDGINNAFDASIFENLQGDKSSIMSEMEDLMNEDQSVSFVSHSNDDYDYEDKYEEKVSLINSKRQQPNVKISKIEVPEEDDQFVNKFPVVPITPKRKNNNTNNNKPINSMQHYGAQFGL
jgi:protease II